MEDFIRLKGAIYGTPVQYIMTSDSLGGEWEESCRWWICALYPGRSFTWHKERLGALSPIYQGTIGVFHHHIYSLFPYSLPHGKPLIRNMAISVCGHGQGHSPTVRIYTFCVYFYLRIYTPQRQRETRSSSAILRPRGVIHQKWIWPWRTDVVLWCTHSPWMDPRLRCWAQGAGGVVGLIRHTVRLTAVRLRGLCSFVLKSWTGISLCDCLCCGPSDCLCDFTDTFMRQFVQQVNLF